MHYINIININAYGGLYMLKLTNKTVDIERDADLQETCTVTEYDVDGTVTLAGDGLWGAEGGRVVRVESIQVRETLYEEDGDSSTMVNVTHDSTWDIYTDSGFEAAVSAALGFDVTFTEQGMQGDNYASMEI